MMFSRITVDHRKMGGIPCIRGLRIPVAAVVGMIADWKSTEEILKAFPDLEREDIQDVAAYKCLKCGKELLDIDVASNLEIFRCHEHN